MLGCSRYYFSFEKRVPGTLLFFGYTFFENKSLRNPFDSVIGNFM